MKEIYRVCDLRFSYGKNEVLKGVNLSVNQGDFLAFIGANGSGKSTLIKLLLGIETPDSGTIYYRGEPVGKDTDFSGVSYVPQLMVSSYDFPITVGELIDLGLYGEKLTEEERKHRIADALSLVDLEGFNDRLYGALSGGQRQRVLIAKALISMTDVLILDEPTTGIDFKAREELFRILRHLHDVHGITIVMITHELHLVEDMIDGIYVLEDGVLEKRSRD
ncbi:MAG: ATP-binding cassette domain-containing protein [Peptoniphilus sp.]|nr:ATP-binding cassette domain-containing protein [Peptoniphilus sp.]MDY3118253.1 ATP-binding cassette domain-containing protein [Peptoniphilus sp.]